MKRLPFDYAVRNLGRSPLRLVAALGGSCLVVLLVLAAGAFVRGMQMTLVTSAPLADNVILLGAGSEEATERSQIDAAVESIAAASVPGIRADAGVDFVSPEIHAMFPLQPSRDSTVEFMAVVRGVKPVAFLVHPEVQMVEGRPPRAGHEELVVGSLAATRLGVPDQRLAPGRTLWFDDREWTITGRFSAPNTVMDAELWFPLSDLQIATKRNSTISCVVLTLGEAEFADVDAFATSRLDLELVAIRESDYYSSLAAFYRPVRAMIWVTAALIAMGGVLGGLNTMYAAFAARIRELGMLQSLGFTRGAIVTSLVQESVLACAAGALLACGIALATLDGLAVRFSMGAFELSVDAPVLLGGLLAGLVLGLAGALPPAWRCLRLPIPEALKAH